MICFILYIDNSDMAIFDNLKKHVKNSDFLKKAEYLKTVTVVKSLLLNYHTNSSGKSQSRDAGNQRCLLKMEKSVMMKVKQMKKSESSEETLTTSPAMVVGEKSTMQ